MHVIRRNELPIRVNDMPRYLHIALHARHRANEVDAIGNVAQSTAVLHAPRLQRRRNGKANGVGTAFGICHNQVGSKRVEPAIDAFHRSVKGFQINAQVSSAGRLMHLQKVAARRGIVSRRFALCRQESIRHSHAPSIFTVCSLPEFEPMFDNNRHAGRLGDRFKRNTKTGAQALRRRFHAHNRRGKVRSDCDHVARRTLVPR